MKAPIDYLEQYPFYTTSVSNGHIQTVSVKNALTAIEQYGNDRVNHALSSAGKDKSLVNKLLEPLKEPTDVGFYMVFVGGGDAPTYKHESQYSASNEAKRLAALLGKKAYVLRALESIECAKFDIKTLAAPDDLPF